LAYFYFTFARERLSHKQHVTVNKTGENIVLTDGLCFLSAKKILRNMVMVKQRGRNEGTGGELVRKGNKGNNLVDFQLDAQISYLFTYNTFINILAPEFYI
jgi:hypothetical protein